MRAAKRAGQQGVRTLTEAKALAALANPFRSRMIDVLKVEGPATASVLAQATGQAVGSASHHLKVLAEAGLVEEAPELARDKRERWWRLVSRGLQWSRSDLVDPAAVSAAWEAEALALRRQVERVQEWLANAETAPEWNETSFASTHWMKLTPAELDEVATEVNEVLMRWARRETPEDGQEREPVMVFARGFPTRP